MPCWNRLAAANRSVAVGRAGVVGAVGLVLALVLVLVLAPARALQTEAAAPTGPGLRSPQDALDAGNSFRIPEVTLFDGERVIEGAAVVVRKGWVESVCAKGAKGCAAPELPIVDGTGRFLMPALIDSEAHFSTPDNMLAVLLKRDASECTAGAGGTVRVSSFDLVEEFARHDLFTEVDTHGLRLANGYRPHLLGGRYPLPPSANYEKHQRFGVTTVLDMGAYPWPANFVRRARGRWASGGVAPPPDLAREFLVDADFYGAGIWAAPAGLQFGYYGMDPVYNLKPEGPWDQAQLDGWIDRRVAEGSDHIKVFYEKWDGAKVPSISAATLAGIVRAAHARGLMVFVHNETEETSEDVIRSGADVNIHAPGIDDDRSPPLSDAFAERFVRAMPIVVPTMTGVLQGCANPFALANRRTHALGARRPGASFVRDYIESGDVLPYINALDEVRIAACGGNDEYERVLRNTAKLYDHGARLLAGVDAAELEPLVEGLGVHYETYLIREALDRYSEKAKGDAATLAALKAATSNPALAYGLHRENGNIPRGDPRGFIKPGYRADLLLLRESPMREILNTLRIERVYKAGYLANRQMVRPECERGDCESRRILRALEQLPCSEQRPREP